METLGVKEKKRRRNMSFQKSIQCTFTQKRKAIEQSSKRNRPLGLGVMFGSSQAITPGHASHVYKLV